MCPKDLAFASVRMHRLHSIVVLLCFVVVVGYVFVRELSFSYQCVAHVLFQQSLSLLQSAVKILINNS